MKQILILSGKGGTGKTTVAAGLAHLASAEASLVLADADVDASNLELVLHPELEETTPFEGGVKAVIDPALCTCCGRCAEVCRFEAVMDGEDAYAVDAVACEGCAACHYQCPAEAIAMVPTQAGEWYRSQTPWGVLFHARLFPGEENSGKLVATVKQNANLWALRHRHRLPSHRRHRRDPVGPAGHRAEHVGAARSGADIGDGGPLWRRGRGHCEQVGSQAHAGGRDRGVLPRPWHLAHRPNSL